MYLRDPDGNGLELHSDRPREAWFGADGRFVVRNDPLDPHELLRELDELPANHRTPVT